jgi:hypothetical protein
MGDSFQSEQALILAGQLSKSVLVSKKAND